MTLKEGHSLRRNMKQAREISKRCLDFLCWRASGRLILRVKTVDAHDINF